MTPQEIEWRDPPSKPTESTVGRVAEFVQILKSRPGQWAVYPHAMSRNGIKHACCQNPKRYPGTEWSKELRTLTLFGRWVGDQ